ncbi:MAG: M15 family metallopeptidase [Clostridia bacterium]|nr:M15 family metallopeptidase [Clostridia bacterium]
MKRDPYKMLLRLAGILAAVVVVGIGVLYLCTLAVNSDYVSTRERIEAENAEAEVEFYTQLNELRSQNAAAKENESGIVDSADLPSWEKELAGSVWRVEDEGSIGLENTSTITLDRASLINGGLLLVNAWHSLPNDFSEEGLISVGQTSGFDIQVQDNSVQLFQPAYDGLKEAMDAAKEDGLEYFIAMEGYRSVAEQEALFSEEMQDLSSRYSDERLIAETKKKVNYPGTSDYHTGMTVRMDVYQRGNSELNDQKFQAESAQGAWLTENCWKYGFVFRFPSKDFPNSKWEDKSYKTGVSSQLNMYRFVGKAHSAAMRVLDMCLEEYIEFLIAHPHICIYENGALVYEVVRINGAGDNSSFALPVPNPANSYQASLDNMDGVVMAYSYK